MGIQIKSLLEQIQLILEQRQLYSLFCLGKHILLNY